MELNLKLDEHDVQLVLQALGELPLKASLNTFVRVQNQLTEQINSKRSEINAYPQTV